MYKIYTNILLIKYIIKLELSQSWHKTSILIPSYYADGIKNQAPLRNPIRQREPHQ